MPLLEPLVSVYFLSCQMLDYLMFYLIFYAIDSVSSSRSPLVTYYVLPRKGYGNVLSRLRNGEYNLSDK